MTTIETNILIAAPIGRVWSILTAFDRYAEWNPYLVRVEGDAIPGSIITVHAVPTPGADPMVSPVTVIAVEPYAMRWEGGLPDRDQWMGDHWFVLTREGDATRLDHFEHFSGSLAATILSAHGATIRDNFIRFNDALRAHSEGMA